MSLNPTRAEKQAIRELEEASSLSLRPSHKLAQQSLGGAIPNSKLAATPFDWPDPVNIPRRAWLFGYWLLRGEITAVIAPGGVGKSMFTAAVSLSLTSGLEFLNKDLPEGPCTVWLWNLEDDAAELARQVTACGLRHGVGSVDCQSRLYVDSGLVQRLCTATEATDGVKILEPVYDALKEEMIARKVDVLIVDPFVSSHEVSENDNGRIDKVAKRWKRLASETKSSIVLVHHTKKMAGREVKAEDSRGAVALINAARSTLVLNPMSSDEAEAFAIADKTEQRRLVRVDDDKPNRAPPESAWWFRKDSIDLGNASDTHEADNVGAASAWMPPDPFEGISAGNLYAVQMAVDAGEFADSVQANDWAGYAIAEVLGLDVSLHKSRIKSLLRTWKHNGAFKVEKRPTSKGREKPFLVVGKWLNPADISTLKSGVGEVGKSGENDPVQTHPTPLSLERGGGGGVMRNSNWQSGVKSPGVKF